MNRLSINVINVIVKITLLFLFLFLMNNSISASSYLDKKIDSLFVISSSGELKYRDRVEPAIEALANLGIDAVPRLIDKFTTRSARERLTIINILKKIGSPAVPDLILALSRPEKLVVLRVCRALGDIKDSSAVKPLINVSGHPSWQVREKAVDALGKINDNQADQTVIAALSDSVGQVRKAAVVASGRLKINEAIEKLIHILADNFYGARMSAIEVLTKLDTTRVIRSIADSLNSANGLTGDLSCQVLGKLNHGDAHDLLIKQAASESASRRAQAAVALILSDPLDNCSVRQSIIDKETDRLVLLKINSAIDLVSLISNEQK